MPKVPKIKSTRSLNLSNSPAFSPAYSGISLNRNGQIRPESEREFYKDIFERALTMNLSTHERLQKYFFSCFW